MTKRSCSKHDNHDWECLDCHAIDRQETCVKKLKAENQRLRDGIQNLLRFTPYTKDQVAAIAALLGGGE